MTLLDLDERDSFETAISPLREAAAYEALWSEKGATFKTIADKFRESVNSTPSELVPPNEIESFQANLLKIIEKYGLENIGIRIHGTYDYPERLRDAKNPIELFYFQGNWDLFETRSVAVVGSRKVSEEGRRRTRKMVKRLVEDGFTIVSGLAEGVDSEAHNAALDFGGRTIAVIGTPLSHVYPKNNKNLQDKIKKDFLLISQVPFLRYMDQSFQHNRFFFPERNALMSALTEATIIIEASDTSGTLTQARSALQQGRKLFILESCFNNPSISWPAKYEKMGAIRVKTYDDIRNNL